jgi:hypothetical protein
LAEAVRTLSADRDRLAARVGMLERNLEDVTGSIRRQGPPTSPTALPANPAAATVTSAAAPVSPAALPVLPAAPVREAAVTPAAAPLSDPINPPSAAAPQATPQNPEPAAATAAAEIPEPAKTELGVDIGGATNSDGLRALWNSTRTNHASMVEGLHPLVATRENSRTKNKELRLIIGPVDSIETATQLCTTLAAARRYCHPVAFEGQKLAETAPERKPAPKPTPSARLPWPFR